MNNDTLQQILQQIANACVPVLCLLITAGGAYIVALIRKKTAQLQQEADNKTAEKYMNMACDAVAQAVTYTAQTFVDALKKDGAFTAEKQLEAFEKAKNKTLQILGDTAVAALGEIYGDFDTWLETKIEQVCREIKTPASDTTTATTAASVASTIAATAVKQLAAEARTEPETVK
jgi:hypothetical protein